MCTIVEHCGDRTAHLAQQVFLDDAEGDTCHAQVLLGTAINHAVFANVYGTGEDIATHVGNHRNGAVYVFEEFCTVDGVVACDVQVIGIRWDGEVLGDVCEVLVGAGSHFHHFAEEFCFLLCLACPDAGIEVGSLLLEEVVGHHAKLQTCTTAEEDNAVAFGYAEQFLEQSNCFVNNRLEVLCTMTCFHERKSAALEIQASSRRCLYHLAREDGGACIKVILFHYPKCLFFLLKCFCRFHNVGKRKSTKKLRPE